MNINDLRSAANIKAIVANLFNDKDELLTRLKQSQTMIENAKNDSLFLKEIPEDIRNEFEKVKQFFDKLVSVKYGD